MSKSLIVKHIAPRSWWRKTCWQLYQELDTGHGIVPAGFETDGASVPRLLWWLFNPMGRYAKAAVLHDHRIVGIADIDDNKVYATYRKAADKQFRGYMIILGVAKWRAYPMYWGVRAFSLGVTLVRRIKSIFKKKGK
jgi:hypothetical protein